MSPEAAQRVTDLFDQAVELPPAERGGFLERACQGDTEVRREVEALLAADAELESRAGTPFWGSSAAGPAGAPRRVGPYRLVRRLGAGGMSEVFLGLRDDGELERRVAVKLIRRELLSAAMVKRFETERQILASLSHPAITRLLDAGRTEDGVPYFIMELIEGEPIDLYCDRHRLSIAARLQIFRQVCLAVHFAHQNLVVHRDIKPSNILVTAAGEPKLLDFGIAKLLNPDLGARGSEPTMGGGRLLTPEYASPEQILGKPVTTASDVYALGVLLFKLLTGADPYRLRERSSEQLERLILTAEPDTPSACVRRLLGAPKGAGETARDLAGLRSTQPRALVRALAGDLDAVTAKALRKEPQNRYVSAEHMAEDLRRHLAGGRPAATDRSGPFRRRWLAAGILFALLLAAMTVALMLQSVRLAGMRALAQREKARTEELATTFQRIFDESTPSRELIERSAERVRQDLAGQPEIQSDLFMTLGQSYLKLGLFDAAAASIQEALATRRRLFGPEHEKVAQSLTSLARVEASQGDYDRAQALHRRALEMRRKLHEKTSLEVAESLIGLGRAFLADGHAPYAEPLLLEALKMQEELLEETDGRIAETLTDLGHVVDQLESPSAAEVLFQKASKIHRRTSGNESWELAVSLVNQAGAAFELGKRQEGEALLQEVARIERRRCADASPGLSGPLLGLAAVALRSTPSTRPAGDFPMSPSPTCRMPPLAVPHLTYLLRGLGTGLTELGISAEARSFFQRIGEPPTPATPALRLVPDTSPATGNCVADGGYAGLLQRCCSGVIAGGTTVCSNADDWGSTWRTCRHVCGSRLVDGCVPPGGVTDTFRLTDCCTSGGAVSGSGHCLNPADYDTTLRTCVHTCT